MSTTAIETSVNYLQTGNKLLREGNLPEAADAYRRTLLTPTSKKLLGLLTKFS